MEGFEVEKALKGILDTSVPLEKKRKKRALRFFHFLVGGETPLEAVELALGRDEKLQRAQLRTVLEIVRLLEFPVEANRKYGVESRNDLVQTLFHCNALYLAQRLLKIQLSDDVECDGIPWKSVYYNCISIIKALLDFSVNCHAHLKSIVQSDTVELLLDYCDGSRDILTTYPAITTLKVLCIQDNEACERVICSNGLAKIGKFILKDNCHKHMLKIYHQGLKPYQSSVLQQYYDHHHHPKQFWGPKAYDTSYNVVRLWSNHVQMCSALIILKIADQNDRHRKLVFKDQIISKGLIKWFKSPVIMGMDCNMVEACVRIVAILCLNEDVAWQLIDKNNLIKYLGQGVQFVERDALTGFLEVVLRLSAHSLRCREAVLQSEEILQSLCMYAFSFHNEVQETVLSVLDHLSANTSDNTNLIAAGFNPLCSLMLGHFYENHVAHQIKTIRQGLSRSREWKQAEAAFGKTRNEFLQSMDGEQAKRLKDLGNDKFKEGEYYEAIYMYTKALEVCPASVKAQKDGKQAWKWWVLPAVLYSNRAQCFLNIEDWSAAAKDCSNAIARCLEDGEEALKILKKTACRRAKALLELGFYHTALNDIAFCLRKEYQDENVKNLYTEILAKYRKHIGPEPIRRCGTCMGGEGEKLKRCANCLEVYCSRECQLEAWENGHKAVCNKSE